ncbi:small ubiquitin-related modifier 3-like precursor [Chytriomyces cf. hyalinus JEL632]|nr:small ubiquitin-related modifier 3-like precursor [Chytriomyces cf. hyalinus JEL632]
MTADVKPNPADQPKVEHITLKVKGPQGDDVEFKIKKTTVLGKVFTAYADKLGVNKTGYRFEFDGERLTEMDTPGKFEMEDGDVIQAFVQQQGGCAW